MRLALPVLVSLLAGSLPVQAQEEGRLKLFGHRYSVLAGATWAMPTQPATRDVYGGGTLYPSVTLWSFATQPGPGLAMDLHANRLREGDNRALLLSAGLGPRWQFAPASAAVAPSLAVRGDAVLLRANPGAPWRWAPDVNADLSFGIARHLVIGGRYDWMPKVDGVDYSSVSVRALVKVF